jgi:hypothetical protein
LINWQNFLWETNSSLESMKINPGVEDNQWYLNFSFIIASHEISIFF